jgi:hypothetical protein
LVGLTPKQHATVKAAAAMARRSVADWVRGVILDTAEWVEANAKVRAS